MGKNFDLSKSSDIRKLSKEIEKQAIKSVVESGIEIDCPHCNKSFKASSGENICPHCKNKVILNFDV